MALELNFNKFGFVFVNAYHRIETVVTRKSGLQVTVSTYINDTAAQNGEEPIQYRLYNIDYMQELGSYASVYNYLKGLPDFYGAKDV